MTSADRRVRPASRLTRRAPATRRGPRARSMTRRAIGSDEPEAAALLVERRRRRRRMPLYVGVAATTTTARAVRALATRRSTTTVTCRGLFAQNRPEKRLKRRPKPRGIACHPRARRARRGPPTGPRDRSASCTPRPLPGRAGRGRSAGRLNGAVPPSSFAISLSSAMRPTSRAHDFSASSTIFRCRSLERLIAVALQHPQVAADHRRRRAELVNGQRQQARVRLLQARAVVVLGHRSSVAQRPEADAPGRPTL